MYEVMIVLGHIYEIVRFSALTVTLLLTMLYWSRGRVFTFLVLVKIYLIESGNMHVNFFYSSVSYEHSY